MEPSNKDNSSPVKGFENEAQRAPRPKSSKPARPGNRDRGNTRAGSPPQEESVHSVRQSFQTALNKISQNETREIGLKEIQGIISANNAPTHLRIYFSSLRDQKRQCDSATKEIEVLIFGYIASIFKKNLLDPLDKPPELLKSVVRLCEYVHSYFKDTNPGVQIACSKALKEIYSSCIEDESAEIVSLIMIEPLYSILNGGADRATQNTAAKCFNEVLKLFQLKNKTDLLENAASRLYTIFLKTNHDFPELLESIALVIFKVGVKGLQGRYTAFVDKLCNIVDSKVVINQYYLTKIEACGALLAFAYALKGAEVEQRVLDNLYDKASPVLRDASKNKIFKVQQAANEALKFWTVLKGGPEAENIKLELPKLAEQEEAEKPRTENKNEAGGSHNFKQIRSRLKQAKFEDNTKQNEAERRGASVGAQESGIDLQNVKYGSQNRGKNFIKSRSGTGGGHVWGSPENTDSKKFAHEKQKKNIKDIISQKGEGKIRPQSVGPKAGDRFMLVVDKKRAQGKGQDTEEDQEEEEEREEREERSRTPPRGKGTPSNEVIEEEQQDLQGDAQEEVEADDASQRGRSRQSEKRPSQSSQKENLSSQASEGYDAELPEEQAPVQFVDKVQKISTSSQMKSDAGVGQNKAKPATATTKTTATTTTTASKTKAPVPAKKVVQEEVRTNVRKTEPRSNEISALEGKLASVIGKSREELSAEIDQRVEDNRQRKSNPKIQPQTQPQQTKVQVQQAQSTKKKGQQQARYKLADEDAYLFKSIEFMDNTDFQTEPNYIDEYDAEAVAGGQNQLTFGQGSSSQGGNVFSEKVQRSSNQIKTSAGVTKKTTPATKPATTTTTKNQVQPQPQVQVQVQTAAKKQTAPKKNTGGMFGLEGNIANVVAGYKEEIIPEFVEKVEVNRSAKNIPKVPPKAQTKKAQIPYKLIDEDASLFKSIEFMDTLDVPSDFNGIEEYMLDPNQYINQATANEKEEETNYRNKTQASKPQARRNERANAGVREETESEPDGPIVIEGEIAEDGGTREGVFADDDDAAEDNADGEGFFVEEDMGQGDEGFLGNMMKKVGLGGKDDKPAEKKKEEPKKEKEAGKEKEKGFFGKLGEKLGFGDKEEKEEKEKDAEKGKVESPVKEAKEKEGEHKEDKEVKSPEVKQAKQESPEKANEAKEKKNESAEKDKATKEPPAQKAEEKNAKELPKAEKAEIKVEPSVVKEDEKDVKNMPEESLKSKLGGPLKADQEEEKEEEDDEKKKGWFGQKVDWIKDRFSGDKKEKAKDDRSKTPEKTKAGKEDEEENDNVKAKQEDEKAKKDTRSPSPPEKKSGSWLSNTFGFSGKKDKAKEEEEPEDEQEEVKEDPKEKKGSRSFSPIKAIKDTGSALASKLGFSGKKDKAKEAEEQKAIKGVGSAMASKLGLSGKKDEPKNIDETQEEIPNVQGVDDDDEENPEVKVKQPAKARIIPNQPAKEEVKAKIEGKKEPVVEEVPGKALEQKILEELGMNMGLYFGKLGGQENKSQVQDKSVESGNVVFNKTPGPNREIRAPQPEDRPIKSGGNYKKAMDVYEDNYYEEPESPVEITPNKEVRVPNPDQRPIKTGGNYKKAMDEYEDNYYEEPESRVETTPEKEATKRSIIQDSAVRTSDESMERQIMEEIGKSMSFYLNHQQREAAKTKTSPESQSKAVEKQEQQGEKFKKVAFERNENGLASIKETTIEEEPSEKDQLKDSLMWTKKGREVFEQRLVDEIRRGMPQPEKESAVSNQKGREMNEQRVGEEIRRGVVQPEKESLVPNKKVPENRIVEETKGRDAPAIEGAWNQKGREIYEQRVAEEIRRGMAQAEKESLGWNQKGREIYEQRVAEEIRRGMEAPSQESMGWNQRGREIFEQRTAEQMRRGMEHPEKDSLVSNQKGTAAEIQKGLDTAATESLGWNQRGREIFEQRTAEEMRRGMAQAEKESLGWNQKGREIYEQRVAEEIRRGMEAPSQESMGWNQKGREVYEQRVAEEIRRGMGEVRPDKFSTLGKSESQIQKTSNLEDTQLGDDILEEIDRQYQGEDDFQNQARGRYYDPEGDFVDSTMDEKTLERYMQNEQNAKTQNKHPSKLLKQVTFDSQAKRSVPETPNFMSSKGNLEDTMVYASTEGFPSQVRISTRQDDRERDYLGETVVSIEGDNVSSSFKPGKTFPPRKVQESKVENVSAGEMWNKAMEDLGQQNYEAAYNRVLASGDDIYLLRMLKLTGPCLKKLNRATAMKLIKRVIALQKSKFFEKMTLGFFENAHRTQVTHNMKIEEQNNLLKALYNMSARSDVVGQTAASLHEAINVDLRTI